MRILLVTLVFTSLAACGKKPAPKSPSVAPMESTEKSKEETGATDSSKPDDADDAPSKGAKSDPCDGGE